MLRVFGDGELVDWADPTKPKVSIPVGTVASPTSKARATASPRLRTDSLARMRETWTLAVFSVMCSVEAISRFVYPRTSRASTSVSFAVRLYGWVVLGRGARWLAGSRPPGRSGRCRRP